MRSSWLLCGSQGTVDIGIANHMQALRWRSEGLKTTGTFFCLG
jgi:hypothetical protein